jgi:hypothetical protein
VGKRWLLPLALKANKRKKFLGILAAKRKPGKTPNSIAIPVGQDLESLLIPIMV